MIDHGFPNIVYDPKDSPLKRGEMHGESFKAGIKELVEIRKELMLNKNPALKNDLKGLALNQYNASYRFNPSLTREMLGIARGSNSTIEDIIILNNYTDFRDIELSDEGCSTISFIDESEVVHSGQTWDMHGSAKNYVCTIESPGEWVAFSLVGCLGMMGANRHGSFVGVNNINTDAVDHGIVWPLLVRHLLEYRTLQEIKDCLHTAPVTGGHNYIISDTNAFAHFEATPSQRVIVSSGEKASSHGFHTNHCLAPEVQKLEDPSSLSSTTHPRFEILEKHVPNLKTSDDLKALLTSHEGYPKSICSHYESGAQDPSMTCGGGVYNSQTKEFVIWRGCEEYDDNFVVRNYQL